MEPTLEIVSGEKSMTQKYAHDIEGAHLHIFIVRESKIPSNGWSNSSQPDIIVRGFLEEARGDFVNLVHLFPADNDDVS